jgi:hypothetical protein
MAFMTNDGNTYYGNAYETVEKIVPLNLENKTKMSIIILKAVN